MTEFFLHSFNTLSHGLIGYIIPFLFVLTIVVFFHELGHFLIARWAGVRVLTFSLGFGPELAGFDDRHGTRWKISAIPLGGYVKVVGDDGGEQLTFAVKRGDTTVQLRGTPELREVKDPFGNAHRLGVLGITRATAPGDVVTERVDPATALWLGVKETWFVVERTLAYIGGVFTGREAADQVGGPLRIAQISGQVATIGLAALVHLAAVLSISIGLLNLFPVPLLDGGHLLFYAVEAVRGRPLSDRAQEMGFRIGLGLVLMLMVFATYNDILHLAAS